MTKLIQILFFWGAFLVVLPQVQSQTPGPPDPPGGHGSGNDQSPGGGGAPIGGGTFILITFAGAYVVKRIYDKKKRDLLD